MAGILVDADVSPRVIVSGSATTATIVYETDDTTSGTIEHTDGFEISHTSFPATAGDNSTELKITIKRVNATEADCRLEFELFGERRVRRVTVT